MTDKFDYVRQFDDMAKDWPTCEGCGRQMSQQSFARDSKICDDCVKLANRPAPAPVEDFKSKAAGDDHA